MWKFLYNFFKMKINKWYINHKIMHWEQFQNEHLNKIARDNREIEEMNNNNELIKELYKNE